ncbi:MAG: D-2-hydroxyacid dehydrogenase [Puniceicoccaceae bacterium]
MKIVVLDGGTIDLPMDAWAGIRELGELEFYSKTDHQDREAIRSRCAGAAVVLTNKVPLDGETISSLPKLRLISTLATGYNVIDIEAARKVGVRVCNVAGYSSGMTAQHALALLLEICNRVGHHDSRVKEGAWAAAEHFWFRDMPLIELEGKTVGCIGFGLIGRRFGGLVHALGASVLAHRRTPAEAPPYQPFRYASLDEVLELSDVVSLHCPETPETKGMMDEKRLGQMKRGSILINTARGGLVDEEAVVAALVSGQLGAYAADVLKKEPMAADNPLRTAPRTVLTPHLGWASDETLRRLLKGTEANLEAFLRGEPINVVS